jgi:cytochrome P450
MREAPRVPGLPVVGNLPALQRDPISFFEHARDTYGDFVRVRFFNRPGVILSDPRAVEHVLVEKQKSYSKRTRGYDNLRKLLGNGLVTSEGSFWLRQRRIMQPAFHKDRIAGFVDLMRTAAKDAVVDMEPFVEHGAPFDFAKDMMRVTLRIVGEALLSSDVTDAASEVGPAVSELLHQAAERTQSAFVLPDAVPSPMNLRFKKAKATLDRVVLEIIARRRAGEKKPDLLSMLLDLVDEETGERMDDAQLRDEVMTIFLAGHETTANALSWTMMLLGQHPVVEERLVREVRDVVGGADVTLEHIARMPFLDAVWKEALRLYPPIWLLARMAEDDDEIDGNPIHKGDIVFASQWLVQRHPKLWKDASSFVPERFLDAPEPGAPGGLPRYAYFPFSGGPRKCIGDVFAAVEAKVILVTLLQTVRFALVPGQLIRPEPMVTLRPGGGVHVVARPV